MRDDVAVLSHLRVSHREARLVAVLAVGLGLAAATLPQGPGSLAGRAAAVGCALVVASSLLWMRRAAGWALGVAIVAGLGLQALCPFVGSWGAAPLALATLARIVFLADGRIVDELAAPTSENAAARMTKLGA